MGYQGQRGIRKSRRETEGNGCYEEQGLVVGLSRVKCPRDPVAMLRPNPVGWKLDIRGRREENSQAHRGF